MTKKEKREQNKAKWNSFKERNHNKNVEREVRRKQLELENLEKSLEKRKITQENIVKPKTKRLTSSFKGLEKTFAKDYCEENKRKLTPAESRFRVMFDHLQIPYVIQHAIAIHNSSKYYIVDFYIPKYGIVVEIDGEYHNRPDVMEKDFRRDQYLNSKGYLVIRITNDQMFKIHTVGELKKILGLFQ